MGLGYTRQQLEQVRRTGMAPRDMRPGVRNPRNRQTDEDLWRWVAAGGAPPSSPSPTPTTPAPMPTPEDDLRKWIEAGGSTTPTRTPRYGMPTDGRYTGFDTRGEMDDYVRGRGILLDQEAAGRYGDAYEGFDTRRIEVEQSYADLLAQAQGEVNALMPRQMDVPEIAAQYQNAPTSLENAYRQLSNPVTRDMTLSIPGKPANPGRPVQTITPNPYGDIWQAIDNVEWGMGEYPSVTGNLTTGEQYERGDIPIPLRLAPQTTMQMVGATDAVPASTRYIGQELWDQNVVPTGKDTELAQYQTDLGGWRDDELARYQAYVDQAQGYDELQPHEWMQLAGINELGMDPSFAAGAYGPEMSLSLANSQLGLEGLPLDQFTQDRDLWSLETYGVPYNEHLANEKEKAALAEAQMTEDEKYAADQAKAEFTMQFSELTGFDPDALASATDIPEEMLVDLIQSDDYNAALATLQGLDPTTGEPAEYSFDEAQKMANEMATDDPTLYRLLKVMFPDLFPKASLAAP